MLPCHCETSIPRTNILALLSDYEFRISRTSSFHLSGTESIVILPFFIKFAYILAMVYSPSAIIFASSATANSN